MDSNEIKEAVVEAVAEGLRLHSGEDAEEAKRKAFYIKPEEHYQHHDFIRAFVKFVEEGKTTVFKTVVRLFVAGFFFLLIAGLVTWWKFKTGGV